MIATYSHPAIQKICDVLKLKHVTSINISIVAGQAVKVYIERLLTAVEIQTISDIIDLNFDNGTVEASTQYYINSRPVVINQVEPTEDW